MKLRQITIRNFKAIEEATLDLADFNVIVGANGSGKSSVLQALHWMLQSGRSKKIEPRADPTKARVLSEKEASYMPTPQYRAAGHASEYGNKNGTPQFALELVAEEAGGQTHLAQMWIRSAHNEGISVHVPSNNSITSVVRASREISAYIPGLAGIPLQEERRGKFIVNRQAAAGDANTVLRNILLRLSEGKPDDFKRLISLVSEVMGTLNLQLTYEETENATILAEFQTDDMARADTRRFKPLELAGIGFLQVIQIFAYLVYFRPVLLLVDEPDAHLHPSTQEKLITVLAEAAREFDTQVILTTHSPSVVRALPAEARVIWMKEGKVQKDSDTAGRQMMGWGLLDKRILLLTEDSKTKYLRKLLSQWPDLERVVAIWPMHGSGKLLDPERCASLQALFGDTMKIALHRDRDFMVSDEAKIYQDVYREKGIEVWLTKFSDIEAYWCERDVIAAHFGLDLDVADDFLKSAIAKAEENDAHLKCFRSKRNAIRNQPPLQNPYQKGEIEHFSEDYAISEYQKFGDQHIILGKTLLSKIRDCAKSQGALANSPFGNRIPEVLQNPLAPDLEQFLRNLLK